MAAVLNRKTSMKVTIKKKYQKQLAESVKDPLISSELQRYNSAIDDITDKLKIVKRLKESKVTLEENQQLLDETYEIVDDVLLKKKIVDNITVSTIRMLSQDDCLQVFLKEHSKLSYRRRDTYKLVQKLKENYIFPKICLKIYLKCYRTCFSKDKDIAEQREFNQIAQLKINEIAIKYSSKIFRYILIYIDKATNFTILRPLMINTEEEVSIELFKIFTEFGPPKILNVYEKGKYTFYENVFERIENLMPMFGIDWVIESSSLSHIVDPVLNELVKWAEKSGSGSWEIGCYIVQWELNSSKPIPLGEDMDKNKKMNKNPYDLLFEKALNPIRHDKSKSSQSLVTNTASPKQGRSDSPDTGAILPELDTRDTISIEIISDESDSEGFV